MANDGQLPEYYVEQDEVLSYMTVLILASLVKQ